MITVHKRQFQSCLVAARNTDHCIATASHTRNSVTSAARGKEHKQGVQDSTCVALQQAGKQIHALPASAHFLQHSDKSDSHGHQRSPAGCLEGRYAPDPNELRGRDAQDGGTVPAKQHFHHNDHGMISITNVQTSSETHTRTCMTTCVPVISCHQPTRHCLCQILLAQFQNVTMVRNG